MIKLLFEKGDEKFIIEINEGRVNYWDKYEGLLWGGPLQYLPPDPKAKLKIVTSRNKIPAGYIELLMVPQNELDEYLACKNDEEIKQVVLKDALNHGCMLKGEKIT